MPYYHKIFIFAVLERWLRLDTEYEYDCLYDCETECSRRPVFNFGIDAVTYWLMRLVEH